MGRYISIFGRGTAGNDSLGGKGYGLDEMVKLGMPVPQGFTVTTDGFREWSLEHRITDSLESEIREAMQELERATQKRLGSSENPLLVSVRSGAKISMPGMMETVLNVGATDEAIAGLARMHGDDFAYNLYRRFMRSYTGVVYGETINLEKYAHKVEIPSLLRTAATYDRFPMIKITAAIESNPAMDLESLIPQGKTLLLNKEYIYHCILQKGRITDCVVRDMNSDHERLGSISEVTEDHVQITWIDGQRENIIYDCLCADSLGKRARSIDMLPEIIARLSDYRDERKTIGQLVPDTLRMRRALDGIPADPMPQVLACVDAVFRSWNSAKAREYRKLKNISDEIGTAVNIQRMVYGNLGRNSGSAVLFSSCPRTGDKALSGEFVLGRQGEELVSGEVTPYDVSSLGRFAPMVLSQVSDIAYKLEAKRNYPQDIEVTWENGSVYVLQTRDAQMSPSGRIGFALRQHRAGKIGDKQLIRLVDLADLESIANRQSVIVPKGQKPLSVGKSPVDGIVSGRIALDMHDVQKYSGDRIIYCRKCTSTDDIAGIRASAGLITALGGAYSHAGIVAINLGKVAALGCEDVRINGRCADISFGAKTLRPGDIITIDGTCGKVYEGKLSVESGRASPLVAEVTYIAKRMVGNLPYVYEAQCVDDLSLPMPCIDTLLYSIDFDCLDSSGALDQKRLSKSCIRDNLRARAALVHEALTGAGIANHIFRVDHRFSDQIKAAGHSPTKLYEWFVHSYLRSSGAQEVGLMSCLGRSLRLTRRLRQKITDVPRQNYANGMNSVLMRPWAPDESYLVAAKEACGYEH